jgi:TolB-like protein
VLLFALALAPLPLAAQADDRRPVLAVTQYQNDTGESRYDNLGRALASMMISDLSVLDGIRLVERVRIDDVTRELDLQQSGYVDPETAVTVGMILGAEWVVTGAFFTADPEVRLDTRIASVESGEIVTAAEVVGQAESLFDLQQRLSTQVIEGIELALTDEEEARLRARQEANRIDDLETMVRFAEALCLVDHGAYTDAAEVLADVRSRAPGSALVRATLGAIREGVEEEAAARLRSEANRRLGGLLGRGGGRSERSTRPARCR